MGFESDGLSSPHPCNQLAQRAGNLDPSGCKPTKEGRRLSVVSRSARAPPRFLVATRGQSCPRESSRSRASSAG